MSKESYEAFIKMFPSTELLCKLLGVASYDEFFESHYKMAAQYVRRGEILNVIPHDVAIAEALSSGLLIVRKNKRGQELFELDKELYRKSRDLFEMMRQEFHSQFVVVAMTSMRKQRYTVPKGGTPHCVYIFKDGRFGDGIRDPDEGEGPFDDADRLQLCSELIIALTKHPLHADIWWEWRVENDSVWLQPKELTDELKAAMQKHYDDVQAQHRFATAEFYPGWQPDRSKDPPDPMRPARATRLTKL